MSQNTSSNNVPSATKGTSDSLAAPGRVGAGGTTLQDFQRFLQHRRFVLRRQIAAADAFDQIVFQDQLKEVQSALSLTADFLKAMTERRA
ncbi:hypothetical protein ACJJWD_16780 [Comamonas testosteroni]|uniref:hypothetical protein n=1 Tax=Comamonas testosteroni TaxID=285 RepID=UPI00389AF788